MKKLIVIALLSACSCRLHEQTNFQKRMLGNLHERKIGKGIGISLSGDRMVFSHETATRVSVWETTSEGRLVVYKSYALCAGEACGAGEMLTVGKENKEEKFRTMVVLALVEFTMKTRTRDHLDTKAEQKRLDTLLEQIPPLKP